ncbi:hypothetical protein QTP86_024231 [Hemibagrus guttatus]|nr:hypothetical protein QTP86_024231 [Hemibagrus guttatus]
MIVFTAVVQLLFRCSWRERKRLQDPSSLHCFHRNVKRAGGL